MSFARERHKALRGKFLEEVANSITHGLGLALAVAGLVILVVFASLRKDPWAIVSCSIYGTTIVLNYLASTLYHSAKPTGSKRLMRVLDHSAIYLLIAGTYTPFALVNLRGPWGWSLFGTVWGIALVGILFKTFFTGRFPILSGLIYLAMGWIVVVAIKPVMAALPRWGLIWLAAGGLAYTAGMLFFAFDKKVRYFHAIWHIFVLAGSVFHFFAVLVSAVLRPDG